MASRLCGVLLVCVGLSTGCQSLSHSGDESSGRPDESAPVRRSDGTSASARPYAVTDKGKEIERSLGVRN